MNGRGPGPGSRVHVLRHSCVCRISFAWQHRSPSGLEVLHLELELKELNEQYRQPMAETGTKALHDLLAPHGPQVQCRMITAVDEPNEVVDVYGRFVGDILVTINGQETNLNHWLVEQGWAFPAFYSFMSKQEITKILQLSTPVRTRKDGVWKNWKKQNKLDVLNQKLIYRGKAAMPDPQEEKGPVIMPKLFRRASTWKINQMAKMVTGGLGKYLTAHPDDCYLTSQFLVSPHTAVHRKLHEFYRSDGTFGLRPDELVFQEKEATLIGPNGTPATDW